MDNNSNFKELTEGDNMLLSEREMLIIHMTVVNTVNMILGERKAQREAENQEPPKKLEIYTIDEAGKILNISKSKMYALAKSKGFPCVRLGKNLRIPKREFNQWIHDHSEEEIQ